MKSPLISIVIPAFNEEKFLGSCLQSLRAQDYEGPVEIIVVDNNSTDATAKVAEKEGASLIKEPRRGVVFAREAGTLAAKGTIIIQTDADSTFPKNWLSEIMKAFSLHPKSVAVAGSFEFGDGPWWGESFTTILFGITNVVYKTTGKLIYTPGSNTAFKREAWHGYNLKYDQGGDESALLKQLRSEGSVVFLNHNTISTSARRLKKGIMYNIVVTFLFYRVFDYSVRRFMHKGALPPPKAHYR